MAAWQASLRRSGFCPSISLFIRYNMRREVAEQEQGNTQEDGVSEGSSSQDRLEEPLSSQQKAEQLRRSVDRLTQFANSIPKDQLRTLPACVEEYCDRIEEYRLGEQDCIVALAQRRLNKMLRNRKIKRNWNNEDITLLIWCISKRIQKEGFAHFSQLTRSDWEFISGMVSGSTWQKCKFRWLGLKKVRLVTHKWSKGESKMLAEVVAEQEKVHWKLVSERLYERNQAASKVFRTAKQCREHWNCFLNPTIHKGPWSAQEDRRLLEFVLELEGAKKWSEIAKFMAGRTENALKNRFNLLLGGQRKASGNLTEKRLVRLCLSRLMLEQGQMDLPTPIQATSIQAMPALRSEGSGSQQPIVPTVERSVEGMGFQLCFDNMAGYLGNALIPTPIIGPNAYYIGFVYPSQF